MGKIADALGKYAQETKTARLPKLTRADLDILLNYNRRTGHLLNYNNQTGQVGDHSMEVLRSKGTIQRLLDNKLIFPGGKLTPKGLEECERLQRQAPVETSTVPAHNQTVEKPAARTNSTEVRTRPEAKSRKVTQSFAIKSPPVSQPEKTETTHLREIGIKEIPLTRPKASEAPASLPRQQKLQKPETEVPAVSLKPGVRTEVLEKAPVIQSIQNEPEVADGDDQAITTDYVRPAKEPDFTVPGAKFDAKAIDGNLVSLWDPQSYESEQFKSLRTSILFPVSGTAPKTILVTSAMPGEGKSFLAANLAISIALNINTHVLLVDCDLRKPDIRRMFGFGDIPGLSEYLREHKELESLLVRTSVDKLTLLPGGSVPPNPSELMSTEMMSDMMEEVKHRYHDRLIVIDSAPPGLAAETVFLARHVDGIIIVVKHNRTPREEVEELMEKMGTDKILGVVVNHLDLHNAGRYRYKKYSKYGKRYER